MKQDMTPKLLKDLGIYLKEGTKYKYRYGLYECQYCGKEFTASTYDIVRKRSTKSCGCLQVGSNTKHNLTSHPLYRAWYKMKYRCTYTQSSDYIDYGGRGIKVCARWLDLNNFIEDMLPTYIEGLTLDRIDVNGNYEPANCRWANSTTQARNTRDIQINNTSGYRGAVWHKAANKWSAQISLEGKSKHLGYYNTALDAAKAYERYVRLNELEHNFTPALSQLEIIEVTGLLNNKNK